MNITKPQENITLRIKDVLERTGIKSRSGIYQRLAPGSRYFDSSFPRPFKIGIRSVAWRAEEVQKWIDKRSDFRLF